MFPIRFSHKYPKLWGQSTAELMRVNLLADINPTLLEYDTNWADGEYYELPKGKVIQLIFLGDLGIPFCTIRRYTDEKWKYYCGCVGDTFKIELKSN